jgi:methyl-accepting chemotaxis protein
MNHLEQSIEEFNDALEQLEETITLQTHNIQEFKKEVSSEIRDIVSSLKNVVNHNEGENA